jgi:acetylornithine/succinyldiaminopimelate/putrescine aminotransferase
MPINLKEIVANRLGENYDLHDKYVNRTLVKVLRTVGFDKVYARAQGSYLYDKDGRDYLDFLSGYAVFSIGRNHPAVQQAIKDMLEMDLPNMVQLDCALMSGLLAEALVKRTGPERDSVFLCNSGTEANEGAIKFARCATGRDKILALEGSYHGLSYGSLSITNNANFQKGFGPLLPGAGFAKYNDLADLETKLKAGDVAGFIVEHVQGKGVYTPDEGYFPKAQELCRKYGTLFISDEVQTGLGRTGKMFAYQHWNLDPDIVTLAKALSGGYVPCAAFVTRRDIYQKVFSSLDRCVVHSSTFGRNNLAMACGLATLGVIDDENLVDNAAKRGEQLLGRLKELQKKHDIIKEVRGKGMMLAIEFQQPRGIKAMMAWKALHAVDKGLFPQIVASQMLDKHRILTQVAGHNTDIVKILPPLIIGDKEIDRFTNAMDDVLENIASISGPMLEFGTNLVKAAISTGYNKRANQEK